MNENKDESSSHASRHIDTNNTPCKKDFHPKPKLKTKCSDEVEDTEDETVKNAADNKQNVANETVETKKDKAISNVEREENKNSNGTVKLIGGSMEKIEKLPSNSETVKISKEKPNVQSKESTKELLLSKEESKIYDKICRKLDSPKYKEKSFDGESQGDGKKTNTKKYSYDDLRRKYEELQTKHSKFSGLIKRSPLSFDDK